jgi:drug/metabolite transporter (DMT)-like permease
MGLFAALLSAFFSSSKDLVSKRLAFRLDGMASTFASFGFALPYYVALLAVVYALRRTTVEISLTFLTLVFLRSVTDTFAEGMKMHAFAHGDISVVASFFSISPLFILFFSPLLTGDPLSVPEVVAVLLVTGGGLILVYRPGHADWHAQRKGILLALGASVFFSLNSCFDRLAVSGGDKVFTPVFAGFTMTLFSAAFLVPFILPRKDRTDSLRRHWRGFAVRGLLEIAFMVCKLSSLQSLSAPKVVSVMRLSLVLSIIGGRVFFKERDFARRLLAGLFILLGVYLIARMHG